MSASKRYLRSSHPAVLEARRENQCRYVAAQEASASLAQEVGADPTSYYGKGSAYSSDGWRLMGLCFPEKPSGHWKRLKNTADGWVPKDGSAMSQQMTAVKAEPVAIPGIPDQVWKMNGDVFRTLIMATQSFEHDGHVYAACGAEGEARSQEGTEADFGWEEVPLSVWAAAMEAFNRDLAEASEAAASAGATQ